MWNALAKFAELGIVLITKLWPTRGEQGTEQANPRDIGIAQGSGYAADREGKIASQRGKQRHGD